MKPRLHPRLSSLAKLQVRPSPFTAIGRWVGRVGANASSGNSLGYALDRCPANPHFVQPGATRRCFALLGGFPSRASRAQRDEDLRGALGVGGDEREGVRVGRSGGLGLGLLLSGLLPQPRVLVRGSCLLTLWRRVALR